MEYEVNLRGEDIMNSKTIGDIYERVAAKKA
jgi:acyl carrier protein